MPGSGGTQRRESATAAVLCTDLVGSTELLVGLGEAAFDEFRRGHFEALRAALQHHGGREIKTMGDGMLAVFGSAADALGCAVTMQQTIDRPAAGGGAGVAIRVGLALGDVSLEDGDVFGTPVVQAARLTAAARGGQILATSVVAVVAGGRTQAACTDLGPMVLKGLPEPVAVSEVAWAPIPGEPAGEASGPEILVLGPIAVRGDGGPTLMKSHAQRVLLAVLAAAGGLVVPADQLVEALWGDDLPANPGAALQSQVSRLRRALAPSVARLETVGTGYRLAGAGEVVDGARFCTLLDRALHEQARGEPGGPESALRSVEAALGLWRGRAYLEVADHAALRVEANRLDELRADAVELQGELLTTLQRPAEAARALEALTAAHPFRERPVALLMRALAADGRHADALAAYERFRTGLREELGLDPSADLRAVQAEVLRPEAVASAAVRPAVGLPANSFVGREAELDAVTEHLRRSRLVTLTGPGGMGKTRLSLHTAAAVGPRYPDGVYVCELAAVTEPGAVAAAVATTLGIKERAGSTVTRRIVEFLAAKRALLVVDNCEHVLDAAAALVGAVLAQAPEVDVLATSRQRLGVAGEQRVPVDALPTPAGDDLAGPAVVLFADRAVAVRPDFTLTGANLVAVCELCRRLDGLPLAIELAAARTVSRSPAEIVAELADRLDRLVDKRRPVDRHRSIDAVVSWSYDLLTSDECVLAERLAVFTGGFTAEAAAAVVDLDLDDLLDTLTALVEHSLIRSHDAGGRTRFSMLEPIRQYAEARLRDQGLLDGLRRRHAEWVVEWAEVANTGIHSPDEGLWAAAVTREIGNLRAAQRWCLDHDADLVVRLTAALYWYGWAYGLAEVGGWAEATGERLEGSGTPRLSVVLYVVSLNRWRKGDMRGARVHAERSLELNVPARSDDAWWGWFALYCIDLLEGDIGAALGHADRCEDYGRRSGDGFRHTVALAVRALALGYSGRLEAAQAELDAARAVSPSGRSPSVCAYLDYVAGEIRAESAPLEALVYLRRARDLSAGVGNWFFADLAGLSAVACAARLGDTTDAMSGYAGLIDRFHRAAAWTQLWMTIRTLVEMLTNLGRDEPAAVLHGALLATKTGTPLHGADADRMAAAVLALRSRLGDERFEALHAEGAALGDDRAVAYALTVVQSGLRSGNHHI